MNLRHMSQTHNDLFLRLPVRSVERYGHEYGLTRFEPLTLAMDAMYRYAVYYSERFEAPLSSDGVLGPAWLDSIKGLKRLLDGDGGVAMSQELTTDTKSNGVLCGLFTEAIKVAGYTEEDL